MMVPLALHTILFWQDPESVGHTAVAVAIFFTADVFRLARGQRKRDYRYKFRDPIDGCARYDDVWGG